MSPIAIILLAVIMSADAFAAALGKGAQLHRPGLAEALRTGVVFGTIEAITPLIGWAAGRAALSYIEAVDHWLAFGLLGIIGAKMVWDGFRDNLSSVRNAPVLLCSSSPLNETAVAVRERLRVTGDGVGVAEVRGVS